MKLKFLIPITVVAIIAIGAVGTLGYYGYSNPVIQNAIYDCPLTEGAPEGPYYIAGAPFKERISEGFEGPRLIVTGKVLNQNCDPIPGAIIDIWQVDADGNYHFEDYLMRGKIKADENGTYKIDTILPANYDFLGGTRPAHLHLKVSEPDQGPYTTQLYFAGDPHFDQWVQNSLVLQLTEKDGIEHTNFDFVILTP
jgi:protocatechuate 3,4-dioxygenase beta subunit